MMKKIALFFFSLSVLSLSATQASFQQQPPQSITQPPIGQADARSSASTKRMFLQNTLADQLEKKKAQNFETSQQIKEGQNFEVSTQKILQVLEKTPDITPSMTPSMTPEISLRVTSSSRGNQPLIHPVEVPAQCPPTNQSLLHVQPSEENHGTETWAQTEQKELLSSTLAQKKIEVIEEVIPQITEEVTLPPLSTKEEKNPPPQKRAEPSITTFSSQEQLDDEEGKPKKKQRRCCLCRKKASSKKLKPSTLSPSSPEGTEPEQPLLQPASKEEGEWHSLKDDKQHFDHEKSQELSSPALTLLKLKQKKYSTIRQKILE